MLPSLVTALRISDVCGEIEGGGGMEGECLRGSEGEEWRWPSGEVRIAGDGCVGPHCRICFVVSF